MVTRFYLHQALTGQAGTLPINRHGGSAPTVQGGQTPWADGQAGADTTINRSMNTTIGTGPEVNTTITAIATTASQTYYFVKFISDPLNQTSIAANTWTLKSAIAESSLKLNYMGPASLYLYVWRPSNGSFVGWITQSAGAAGYLEPSATNTEKQSNITFTGSAIASGIQAGDVIIAEIWSRCTQASGPVAGSMVLYYDGTTIPSAAADTTVSNIASYLETPETIAFQAPTRVQSASKTVKYNLVKRIQSATRTVKYNLIKRVQSAARTIKYNLKAGSNVSAVDFVSTSTQYVDCTNNATLKQGQTAGSEVTYSYWVKVANIPAANQILFIPGDTGTRALIHYINPTDGHLTINTYYHDTTSDNYFTGAGFCNNTWHYITHTHSNITNHTYIYLDGVQVKDNPKADYLASSGTGKVFIGANNSGDAPVSTLNGQIDDFRVYNVQLTLAQHNNLRAGGNETSGLVARFKFDENTGTTSTDSVGAIVASLVNGASWYTADIPYIAVEVTLTRVQSATRTVKYNILKKVQSVTRTVKYNLIKRIQSATRTVKYNLLKKVLSLQKTVKYNLVKRIQSLQRTIKYNLIYQGLTRVQSLSKTVKYNLRLKVQSATRTINYNLLKKVQSVTRTIKYNLIKRIAGLQNTAKYNILKQVTRRRSANYSLYLPILGSNFAPENFAPDNFKVEAALTRVQSSSRTIKYNLIKRIQSLQRTAKYNILKKVASLQRTAKYNILKKVLSLQKTVKYNLIKRILSLQKTVKYNLIKRVLSSQRTVRYNLIKRVLSSQRILKYNLWKQVTSTPRTAKYNLWKKVTIQRTVKYNLLRKVASAQKTVKYHLLWKVAGLQLTVKYDLIKRIQSFQRTIKYNLVRLDIIRVLSAAQNIKYNLRLKVALQRTAKYSLWKKVTGLTKTVKYNLLLKVARQRTVKYNLWKKVASSTQTIKYNLIKRVQSLQRTIKYNLILQGIVRVSSLERTVKYNIRLKVLGQRTVKYNLRWKVAGLQRTIKYNILKKVLSSQRTAKYNLRKQIKSLQRSIKYNLLAKVARQRTAKYNLWKKVASAQTTAKWNILKKISSTQRTIKYNLFLQVAIAAVRSIKYNLRLQVQRQRTVKYNLLSKVTGFPQTAKWNILKQAKSLTRTIRYRMLKQVSIQRTINYWLIMGVARAFKRQTIKYNLVTVKGLATAGLANIFDLYLKENWPTSNIIPAKDKIIFGQWLSGHHDVHVKCIEVLTNARPMDLGWKYYRYDTAVEIHLFMRAIAGRGHVARRQPVALNNMVNLIEKLIGMHPGGFIDKDTNETIVEQMRISGIKNVPVMIRSGERQARPTMAENIFHTIITVECIYHKRN